MEMTFFIIGATLGCLHLAYSLWRHPTKIHYPVQGLITAAVLGAIIYGTVLWLLARYVF